MSDVDLEKHMEKFHGINCSECDESFPSRQEMIINLWSKHAHKRCPCKKSATLFSTKNEKFDVHLSGIQHNRSEDSESEEDEKYLHN